MNASNESTQTLMATVRESTCMQTIAESYLDDRGWSYWTSRKEESGRIILTTVVRFESSLCRTIFEMIESRHRFGIFAYAPFKIPEAKRLLAMEYLTRVNYRVFLAKFEFDMTDGECRVACTVIPDNSSLSTEMVRRMHRDVNSIMETYIPGIFSIVYGKQTVDEVWARLVKPKEASLDNDEGASSM